MNIKVAILQHKISKGGRLSVIARMVKNLNDVGIIPDIITGSTDFNLKDIPKWYGYSISANTIDLNVVNRHMPEYQLLRFNIKVNKHLSKYDWVINSTNTSHFIKHSNLLEYLHFPRYSRILEKQSINNLGGLKKLIKQIEHVIVKKMYKSSEYPECDVYANSYFTAKKFKELYPYIKNVQVLYPPVSIRENPPKIVKTSNIVNLSRFHPSKGQFEIIQFARNMPEFHFSLVGFAAKSSQYLKKCINYIDQTRISNVSIHPNVSIKERDTILKNASYFLHLLEYEPFGISTVQGIANGCVPIVPNNGGQVEIVNNKMLRYNNLDQVPAIIKGIHKHSHDDFYNIFLSLFDHIQTFSEVEFDQNFKMIIKQYV